MATKKPRVSVIIPCLTARFYDPAHFEHGFLLVAGLLKLTVNGNSATPIGAAGAALANNHPLGAELLALCLFDHAL